MRVLILVRPRQGAMGESRRLCHLIPKPSSDTRPIRLAALCGTQFAPDELEWLERPAGMPCLPCLLAAPTPTAATLPGEQNSGEGETMYPRVSRLVGAALLVPMLAACGSDDTSQPLDPAEYIDDPCRSLTSEQENRFGALDEGTAKAGQNGPMCTWLLEGGGQLIGVSYLTTLPGGLNFMYEKKKLGDYDQGYFETSDMDGYPAVHASPIDQRAEGICDVAVGIVDDLMLSVSVMATPGTQGRGKVALGLMGPGEGQARPLLIM
jgi:hypothetical protein